MIFSHITDTPGEVASIAMQLPYQADALSCYQMLTAQSPYSLLLESAEIDSKDNLKSLLLIDAALRVECNDQTVVIRAVSNNGAVLLPYLAQKLSADASVEQQGPQLTIQYQRPPLLLEENARLQKPNPFTVLRTLQRELHCQSDEPFAVFLGGVIGYDMVATVEQLPDVPAAENKCPDYVFYLAETLLVLDHQTGDSRLVGNVFCGEQAPANCFVIGKRLEQLKQLLLQSKAIPDAQDPWLDDPLDIGGAPAMVDLAYVDFMLTTINLTNTSLFPVLPHPSMSCSHLSSIVNPRLADSLKWGGGILLDLAYSDAQSNNKSIIITWGFSLLFYSPNNQGLPLPACTRTLHYDERETVFLDIFLLFTSHLSLEHRR